MRRLVLSVLLAGVLVALFPASASAHDLSCDKAREIAGHPNAYCYKASPNHAYLYFPWRTCEEHVWQSHYQDWFWTLHRFGFGGHCPWG